jgi:hypothetical protein
VGSLSFLKFATGSSFVNLPPSFSVSSLRRAAAAVPAMCRAPLPRCRLLRPYAGRPYFCHAARLSARAAPRHCSPSQQPSATSCFSVIPTIPRVTPWPTATLLLPAAFFHARHAVPAANRVSPCRHARRWHAGSCFRTTTSCSRSRAHPGAPSTLVLVLHTHILLIFSCSDHLPSPDLRRASWPPSSATHATPGSNPVLPEHHRDPLVLLSPSNFGFSHRSTTLHSASELRASSSLGLPSTRRCKASPPRPRAPTAPRHLPEAIPHLLHHPPSPQPVEHRPPSPPVRARSSPHRRQLLLPRLRSN